MKLMKAEEMSSKHNLKVGVFHYGHPFEGEVHAGGRRDVIGSRGNSGRSNRCGLLPFHSRSHSSYIPHVKGSYTDTQPSLLSTWAGEKYGESFTSQVKAVQEGPEGEKFWPGVRACFPIPVNGAWKEMTQVQFKKLSKSFGMLIRFRAHGQSISVALLSGIPSLYFSTQAVSVYQTSSQKPFDVVCSKICEKLQAW